MLFRSLPPLYTCRKQPSSVQVSAVRAPRPVSYTHLDVYKRQLFLFRRLDTPFASKPSFSMMKVTAPASMSPLRVPIIRQAVSYTHLDVYKRQQLRCRTQPGRIPDYTGFRLHPSRRLFCSSGRGTAKSPCRCLLYTSRCV